MIRAAETTRTTVSMALLLAMDFDATTVDARSDRKGSQDRQKVRMTDVVVTNDRFEDDNTRGGNRRATEAVNALDYIDGRGIAGTMMMTRTTTRMRTRMMTTITTMHK